MGGVIRGAVDVVRGVARGVGRVVGGVVEGAGKLLSGDPIGALGSVVGGVVKGTGEVLHGGLSAVKSVAGDPIVGGVIGGVVGGVLTFGNPLGIMAGAGAGIMAGQAISGVAGFLDNGVQSLFGVGPKGECAQANNCRDFGPCNGGYGNGCGGVMQPPFPPYGYGGFPGGGFPGGGFPGGGMQNPQMMMMMMGMMSQMMGMMQTMQQMQMMQGGCGMNNMMMNPCQQPPFIQPPCCGCMPGGPRQFFC